MDAFCLVLKLLEVVVPQRAAHMQIGDPEWLGYHEGLGDQPEWGATISWGETLSGLRALDVAMHRDGDLLEQRAEFSAVAQKAEQLEIEVGYLNEEIMKAVATALCTTLADLVADRDSCRWRLL